MPFLDTHLIAWRDGLIAVESQREREALQRLNTFMAVALLLGLPTSAISGSDLVRMGLQPGTTNPVSLGTGLYSRTQVMIGQRFSPTTPTVQRRWVLSEEDFHKVVGTVVTLVKKKGLSELLQLYLYGDTFMKVQEEFSATFIFAWTVIERYLYDQVSLLPVASRRKNKLSRFSVEPVLEILAVSGCIHQKQYETFTKLKDIRNDVVHRAKLVSKQEALMCMTQSKEVLFQLCGLTLDDQIRLTPTT